MKKNNINKKDYIVIKGARVHNLKNIDVSIPRNKLVVITGLSGSGKSSLAFDTIYAEGQRRYVESLSAYARQFLGLQDKPDVDSIEGLGPAISIDQKSVSHNPRSTVGTITEIYDYLRLLFARIGVPHCPKCGNEVKRQTIDQMIEKIYSLTRNSRGNQGLARVSGGEILRIMLLAPVVRDKKGEHKNILAEIKKAGYVRVRFDGEVYDIDEALDLGRDKQKKHNLEVVVDRIELKLKPTKEERSRISESLETALDLGNGLVKIVLMDRQGGDGRLMAGGRNNQLKISQMSSNNSNDNARDYLELVSNSSNNADDIGDIREKLEKIRVGDLDDENINFNIASNRRSDMNEIMFSQHFSCPGCGVDLPELEPRSFSFNSPYGACPECTGLGNKLEVDEDLVIPNKNLTIAQGAIRPWSRTAMNQGWYFRILAAAAKKHNFSLGIPVKEMDRKDLEIVFYGTGEERYDVKYVSETFEGEANQTFEGVVPNLERRYRETESDFIRSEIEKYMRVKLCPKCRGKRLKPEILAVAVGGKNISEVTGMTVSECKAFFEELAE